MKGGARRDEGRERREFLPPQQICRLVVDSLAMATMQRTSVLEGQSPFGVDYSHVDGKEDKKCISAATAEAGAGAAEDALWHETHPDDADAAHEARETLEGVGGLTRLKCQDPSSSYDETFTDAAQKDENTLQPEHFPSRPASSLDDADALAEDDDVFEIQY